MSKINKVFFLLVLFIILSTYNSKNSNLATEENTTFFKIENIIVNNNFIIKKEKIKKQLKENYNKSIFLIKESEIKKSLNKLEFLKDIEVKKKYPNTLIVKIYETKPIAILFKDKVKYLLDSSSNLIVYKGDMHFTNLPNIIGNGSEKYFINFFNLLKNNSFPTDKIKTFYYFKISRWDIQLKDDKMIKYPRNFDKEIINKSIELINRNDFKNYNIIDLRVDGKIIVE